MCHFYRKPSTNIRLLLVCSIVAFQLLFCSMAGAEGDHPEVDLDKTPSAFALFKEQAEQGDVEAQYNLGVMCETGWSVKVDNRKAVRWFRAAAEQGDKNAQLRLGMLYYLGLGASQSNIKGEKWIRKAAEQNQPLAKKMNRLLFSDDFPAELSVSSVMSKVRASYLKNERKAIPVLQSLLRKGRQQAQRAKKQKDETTLRERRVERSIQGPMKPGFTNDVELERIGSDVPAFMGDATLEENRTLLRGNIATIRLQAEKGLANAQYNLGRMYELGIKLPTDKKQAMEWYGKAAKQHFADAEYRMGISLLYGIGVKRNEPAGKKWLVLAARHGHLVAKNMMNEIRDGNGSAQQGISLAVRWYLERALVDDGRSAFHLGKTYENGWGVKRDFAEAIKWYRRAAQTGNIEATSLADNLQPRLAERNLIPEKGWLGTRLEQNGLPAWLAHPVVILSIIFVLFWPILPWSKKARRKKAREAALKKVGQL